ncbi:MAG: hypothetical protein KKE86_16790 [Planctomycetes bacterium]|nr:hypothetical protein [Planctomycetota bacterium]
MKEIIKTYAELHAEGRWDIDYHLPPEGIKDYPEDILIPVSDIADISKSKKDPTLQPDVAFQYVDISSVDVYLGYICNPTELTGEEAPSRARKLIKAFNVIASTCRPTRGAIAVVPPALHGEICSTGFSVLECMEGVNPYYLHFVLRLPSTLEQFRKFSTGSSYPAILDSDIMKTLVPYVDVDEQDAIAAAMVSGYRHYDAIVTKARAEYIGLVDNADNLIKGATEVVELTENGLEAATDATLASIKATISELAS